MGDIEYPVKQIEEKEIARITYFPIFFKIISKNKKTK